jgi:hypothetical protein
VGVAVSVGVGVRLGRNVGVREGVKLSTAGWKGVGVSVAFGSTVTRTRGGEEAGGYPAGRVQAVRVSVKRKKNNARLRST